MPSPRGQGPKPGDVILRAADAGFELVDAENHRLLAKGLPSIAAAVEAARVHGAGDVWQQHIDNRGRPLVIRSGCYGSFPIPDR